MSAHESIEHLPEQILFSLARNESATKEYRKAAVQLLIEHHSQFANHIELSWLAAEVRAESEARADVETIVESAANDEAPEPQGLTTSVTTKTLFQNE